MSDIKCPNCGTPQEINHDDGYGFSEDTEYEQWCSNCDYEFKYTTSISYHYNVYCQDGDHNIEPWGDRWPRMYGCTKCEFYELRRKD